MLGFVLAPPFGVLVAALVLMAVARRAVPLGDLINMLLPAYAVAFVVGIPAYLMSRPWRLTSVWSYAVVGAVAACPVAIPIAGFFGLVAWASVILLAGASAGVAFGFIIGTESNNRWRGP